MYRKQNKIVDSQCFELTGFFCMRSCPCTSGCMIKKRIPVELRPIIRILARDVLLVFIDVLLLLVVK